MTEPDLDELYEELAEFAPPEKKTGLSAREERIIAGFEDIQRFVEQHGRPPRHGQGRDIFERLYAVRLDRLRELEECRGLLDAYDQQGLLSGELEPAEATPDDDALLEELAELDETKGIGQLRHVRASAEKRVAEEIANREKCENFEQFKPLFGAVSRELKAGIRQSRPLKTKTLDDIQQGTFFILDGQIAYIAAVGDSFTTDYGRRDSRLRVVYDNGTESHVLQRSFQRSLHYDETARIITEPDAGPLFSQTWEKDDVESGTIYVLRSLSNHPFVAEHRDSIHKIGVTGGKVETRIANVVHDATYLLAEVEIVATYKLAKIKRTKLENLLHRIFAPAQLDLTIQDRFGHPVKPREWFVVPLQAIDEAIQRIRDGSITGMIYDPKTARLVDIGK
jgi:hypothetical protein